MERQEYGVVRLDKVIATYVGHIDSVVYQEGILENGMMGVVGDLVDGERELREFKKVDDLSKPLSLIYSPEVEYNQCSRVDNNILYFHIPKGVPTRAYRLVENDIFSVSKKMVVPIDEVAGVQKSNYVVGEVGSLLLKEVDTLAGTEAFVGKIHDLDTIGTTTMVGQAGLIGNKIDFVAIEVIKNI